MGCKHYDDARDLDLNTHDRSADSALWLAALAQLSIARTLLKIERHLRPHGRPTIGLRATIIGKGVPMSSIAPITVDNSQDIGYTTDLRDAQGNPRTATLAWHSTDNSVVSLAPSTDTLAARGITGAVGSATVSVTDGNVTDDQLVSVTQAPPPPVGTINLAATVIPKL